MSILLGIIFTFIYSIKISREELPLSMCGIVKPFKTMNNSCANFVDVCVKTGDKECQNFQNVCQQCPAYNYSIQTFLDVRTINDRMSKIEEKINQNQNIITNRMSKIEDKMFQNQNNIINTTLVLVYCIMFMICLILVVLFVEVRFKLCTKIFKCLNCRQTQVNYQILKSRKYLENDNLFSKWNEVCQDMSRKMEDIDSRINGITGWIEKLLTMPTIVIIKFQVTGLSKPIELNVNLNENVIQIKRRICSRWPAAQRDSYKKMKVIDKGKYLDDNHYLLTQINSIASTLKCSIDDSINPEDFLVISLRSNRRIPDLFQVKKTSTVKEMKILISSINKFISDPVIKEMYEGKDLNDMNTLESYSLRDDDWIKIITRESGDLTIKSLFDDKIQYSISYSNFDSIENLKRNFAKKIQLDSVNLVLFLNELDLKNQKFVYDYDIDMDSSLSFCFLERWSGINITGNAIEKDYFFQLLPGEYNETREKILIKKYSLLSEINLESQKDIIKEMSVFQISQQSEQFVKLLGIYFDEAALYAEMEYIEAVSMLEFIKKNSPLKENKISLWCRQILEGLRYLHYNNMIHGNIRPTNIVVDNKGKLKLLFFNISVNIYETDGLFINYSVFPARYSAPEIFDDEGCTSAADIWSFGSVLIYIVTGSQPYETLSESEVVIQIQKDHRISFSFPTSPVSDELKAFLQNCLIYNPEKRPTAQQLLENEFITNHS